MYNYLVGPTGQLQISRLQIPPIATITAINKALEASDRAVAASHRARSHSAAARAARDVFAAAGAGATEIIRDAAEQASFEALNAVIASRIVEQAAQAAKRSARQEDIEPSAVDAARAALQLANSAVIRAIEAADDARAIANKLIIW